MDGSKYDSLKLENQLCFPLYAASREIIKRYTPLLEELDLTYTQYIALMLLWEKQTQTVKQLGEALYLDSGTLTPLLKKMEGKGLVTRARSAEDERNLIVTATEKGMGLREKALHVQSEIVKCVRLAPEEAMQLYRTLYRILESVGNKNS